MYREYAGGRRSLEVTVMKKAGLWHVIHFCKEAWNKLLLACILCKKNCKNTLEQLVLICNICSVDEWAQLGHFTYNWTQ